MRWSENIVEFVRCRLQTQKEGKSVHVCTCGGGGGVGGGGVCVCVCDMHKIHNKFIFGIIIAYNEKLKEFIAQDRPDLFFN